MKAMEIGAAPIAKLQKNLKAQRQAQRVPGSPIVIGLIVFVFLGDAAGGWGRRSAVDRLGALPTAAEWSAQPANQPNPSAFHSRTSLEQHRTLCSSLSYHECVSMLAGKPWSTKLVDYLHP